MVSKAFFTGSKYLVEENDGRRDYLRYDDERFLSALAYAGRTVIDAPVDAEDPKSAYLKALVALNERYFAAREYEADAKGKYYKHDEMAERRFRIRTAERFSDAVGDLRSLLAAHDGLVEAASRQVGAGDDGPPLAAIRSTLAACTDRAVSEAWFPAVEAYYYSLSPGELVAEDRERRKQRVEGTESSRGIAELLTKPSFEKLTDRELRRVREFNRESPGPDARVWKRLHQEYRWFLAPDADSEPEAEEATASDES